VDSSAVESVGYDARSRTLEVEYADGGGVYRYFDVPPRAHDQLLRAESIGGYVNRRIKPYHRCVPVAPRRRRARPEDSARRRTPGAA
jgi:hypothetical protein